MTLILLIETATKSCSVALALNGKVIACKEEVNENYSHAEKLNTFIIALFQGRNISMQDLDAITVSKGPGSYTGLRIGVSTAKGICYGLKIPLISIPTLQAMAFSIKGEEDIDLYCPMIDARRLEVYSGIYNQDNEEIRCVQANVIDSTSYQSELAKKILFFGDNISKCEKIIKHENAKFINNFYPSVKKIGPLVYKRFQNQIFEDLAYFEPFYLLLMIY